MGQLGYLFGDAGATQSFSLHGRFFQARIECSDIESMVLQPFVREETRSRVRNGAQKGWHEASVQRARSLNLPDLEKHFDCREQK